MRRRIQPPRKNWQTRVEEHGLHFHSNNSRVYWDESVSYLLSTHQVDTLEYATNALHQMCIDLVDEIIRNRDFGLFLVPKSFEHLIIQSWEEKHPSIYGRFDFAYDGLNPPKLLEFNADTPTSLLEASVIQWFWLKDTDPSGDQFNSIHEKLVEIWRKVGQKYHLPIHFCAMQGIVEDYVTVEYLRDTAMQAELETSYLDINQIGWDSARNCFVDLAGNMIHQCFKLYPWEWLFREEFSKHLPTGKCWWMEPAWKMLLSSKSILPMLYERYPECPFLLNAAFEPLSIGDQVQKPVYSREGANITIYRNGKPAEQTDGPYNQGPYVYQQLASLKCHDGNYPIVGSWVIDGESAGIGIREDSSPITQNTSRFVPHQMSN